MKHSAKSVLSAVFLAVSSIELASAREAVKIPDSIRPPDPVVKVIDLPDTEDFKLTETTYFDLGYRHINPTTGEWVGYMGSGHRFLMFKKERLNELLEKAGIAELPPPPGFFDGTGAHPRQIDSIAAVQSLLSRFMSQLTTYHLIALIAGALLALNAVVKLMRRSSSAAHEPVMAGAIQPTSSDPTRVVSSFGTPPGGARTTFGKRI